MGGKLPYPLCPLRTRDDAGHCCLMPRYAALLLTGLCLTCCSWFGGKSNLLAPFSGSEDAVLQKAAIAEPDAQLCGLATSDNLIRMMAKGRSAVVNVGGRARLLTMTADQGTAGKTYAGDGVEISLSFVEDLLDKSGHVIGHKAGTMVRTASGIEHFYGLWDC
jgi:hypothetical protein